MAAMQAISLFRPTPIGVSQPINQSFSRSHTPHFQFAPTRTGKNKKRKERPERFLIQRRLPYREFSAFCTSSKPKASSSRRTAWSGMISMYYVCISDYPFTFTNAGVYLLESNHNRSGARGPGAA